MKSFCKAFDMGYPMNSSGACQCATFIWFRKNDEN